MYQGNVINFPKPVQTKAARIIEEHEITPSEMFQWMALEEGVVNALVIAERRDGTLSVVCNKDLQEAMNLIDLGIDCIIREES